MPFRQHNTSQPLVPRLATTAEAGEAAEIILAARSAAVPSIPPLVHSDEEVRTWFADSVMASREVWVLDVGAAIVGVMVITAGWIDQLYVHPNHTNHGLGSALLLHAQSLANERLDLWTFVSNTGAQRFYLRHGFVEIDRTEGENEEGEPDIRLCWTRSDPGEFVDRSALTR
ncbi:MAG: GNAT family N-acetyltransferase [Acidobacteria bacterium]|nr:GNAT family N-acetyltransferase [Acidobacteriota bacterium]